ncbi:hypothetical protein OAN96_00630 [Candidatus Gracilibacteria bacterium]|nr:hypothetical protein [Candidatus Gracilibacteria bacterium]
MGLLSPLSPILVSKIGLVPSIVISNIFRLIGTGFLLTAQDFSSVYLFLIFVVFSIDGAIYHPLISGIISHYVKNTHKGRVNSLTFIISSLAIIVAVFVGGYFIAQGNNILLLGLITGSLVLSNLSYICLLDKYSGSNSYTFREVFRYLLSPAFRENLIPFSMQTFLIIEKIFIPLFIFTFVGDFQVLSYIVGFAVLIEFIVLFLFGKRIDIMPGKGFFQASFLRSLSSIFFIFFSLNTWLIFFNQTYAKISEKMFDSSFGTLLQTKAKKGKDAILFVTAKEMTLCFTEFFILIGFSGFAYVYGDLVFMFIYLCSFLAVWVMYNTWRD